METTVKDKRRNSSIELLRLFCIFGIVVMHLNGKNMESCIGINLIWAQIENTIFQTGVSIFMLISGYFGIKTNIRKIIKMECFVLFYSIITGVISVFIFDKDISILLKSFLPISSNKYWFMSCYMVIMIFAPTLNYFIKSLSKERLIKVLLTLCFISYVLPTIFYFNIFGNSGKNIINMLCLYLLGGFIKKYNIAKLINKKILYIVFILTFSFIFIVDTILSYVTGGVGIHIPLARDCSVFLLIEAVTIFLLFLKFNFTSTKINKFAKYTLSVYLFESCVRMIAVKYIFDYYVFSKYWFWFLVNILISLIIVVICVLFDSVRAKIFDLFKVFNRNNFFSRQIDRIANLTNSYYIKLEKFIN